MTLVPVLRSQIVFIVSGLAALSTLLSTMVAMSIFDRVAATNQGRTERLFADAAGRIFSSRCEPKDIDCLSDVVKDLMGESAKLVPFGQFGVLDASPIPGTEHGVRLVTDTSIDDSPVRSLLVWFAALNFTVIVMLGVAALVRGLVRPVESLATHVERVGRLEFGEIAEGHQLGRLGTSLRRMVRTLSDERERVERQIGELEEANSSLREAQEGLVRSEKLASVGRLSAGLAHEIGNPLGGLVGYLQILRSRLSDDARNIPLVEGAVAACERIDQTVRGLLDLSRPCNQEPGPFEVESAVADAMGLVRPQKRFENVEIECSVPRALPPVLGDHGGLVQVLVNLLLNAADAMEGRGVISISADLVERGVVVTVRDTGPGIPFGSEEDVFEPFFTTKDPGHGTGLGLAVSRIMVEGWGGRLSVDSPDDASGAVFCVTMQALHGEAKAC